MKKRKVCFLVNDIFSLGGVQRVVSVIANSLCKDYDITILCIGNNVEVNRTTYNLDERIKVDVKSDILKVNIIKKIIYKIAKVINERTNIFQHNKKNILSEIYFPKCIREKLYNHLNSSDFDIVIGVEGNFSLLLATISDMLDCKTMGWQHNSYDAYLKNKNKYHWKQDCLFKKYLPKLDRYIVLTNYDKRMYKKEMDIDCIVINNPKSFISNEKSKLINKQFLAAGRFNYQKGFDLLIESFNEFAKHNDDWNLVIVGEGEEKDKIIKLINKYNLQNRIQIDNFTDNIQKYFLQSSILLLPSRWEGMPMIVLESMEMGVPVISYDISACTQLIKNNCEGILVDKYNTKQFAQGMNELSSSYKKRKEMSKHISDKIKNYDINTISLNWKIIISELVN